MKLEDLKALADKCLDSKRKYIGGNGVSVDLKDLLTMAKALLAAIPVLEAAKFHADDKRTELYAALRNFEESVK